MHITHRHAAISAAAVCAALALMATPATSNPSEPATHKSSDSDAREPAANPLRDQAQLSPNDLDFFTFRDAAQDVQLPAGVEFQHVSRDPEKTDKLEVVVTAEDWVSTSEVASHFEKAAAIQGYDVEISVAQSALTDDQLTDASNEVVDKLDEWAGELASIVVRIGPDYQDRSVLIESTEYSVELQERAQAAFSVDFKFQTTDAPYEYDADRFNDTSPWTAGNALSHAPNSIQTYCTQGFNWRRWSDGARLMSTAGHCFAGNTSVYNGNNATQRMGVVIRRWFSDGGPTDFEFIQPTVGAVDNSMWNNINYQDVWRRVVAASNVNDASILESDVCISGARTLTEFPMSCGYISAVNQTIRFNNDDGTHYTIRNLTCVASAWDLGRGGDSGAPVFSTYTNGTIYAWGQHVGSLTNGGGPCAGYFTPVVVISATAQASLIIS